MSRVQVKFKSTRITYVPVNLPTYEALEQDLSSIRHCKEIWNWGRKRGHMINTS